MRSSFLIYFKAHNTILLTTGTMFYSQDLEINLMSINIRVRKKMWYRYRYYSLEKKFFHLQQPG